MSLDERFKAAAEAVRNLTTTPTQEETGEIYGLFKQATVGDINISRPGFMDPMGAGKWDAWNENKGLSQEEAKEKYISSVQKLIDIYGD